MVVTEQTMQFLYVAAVVLSITFTTLGLAVTIIRLGKRDNVD